MAVKRTPVRAGASTTVVGVSGCVTGRPAEGANAGKPGPLPRMHNPPPVSGAPAAAALAWHAVYCPHPSCHAFHGGVFPTDPAAVDLPDGLVQGLDAAGWHLEDDGQWWCEQHRQATP